MALQDIDTFVVVMLENRSFDHVCGYLSMPSAGPTLPVEGLQDDPAWQLKYRNDDTDGTPRSIHRLDPAEQTIVDPPHEWQDIKIQIETPTHGNAQPGLGGFVKRYRTSPKPIADPSAVMGYYTKDAVPVFDFFARNFAVCDHWFSSLPAGTQPNRLMAMSGESQIANNVGNPFNFPDQPLVYDWVDQNLGANNWCAYQWAGLPFFALMRRWLPYIMAGHNDPSNLGVFRRYAAFADQWGSDDDVIPNVVFIEPRYTDDPTFSFRPHNDDHCPTGVSDGQKFLADIYNTLIGNPKRWKSTALIITYDEHGGFFDHVPPLAVPATTDDGGHFATTGIRVPTFVISPHVKPGSVFKDNLDATSVLQLLADRFTPGQAYSPAVAARQAHFRPLSPIFDNPPALQPKRIQSAVLEAMVIPSTPSAVDSGETSVTEQAFENVAAMVEHNHPDQVAKTGDLTMIA